MDTKNLSASPATSSDTNEEQENENVQEQTPALTEQQTARLTELRQLGFGGIALLTAVGAITRDEFTRGVQTLKIGDPITAFDIAAITAQAEERTRLVTLALALLASGRPQLTIDEAAAEAVYNDKITVRFEPVTDTTPARATLVWVETGEPLVPQAVLDMHGAENVVVGVEHDDASADLAAVQAELNRQQMGGPTRGH